MNYAAEKLINTTLRYFYYYFNEYLIFIIYKLLFILQFHISNNLDDEKIHCKYCNSQCVTKTCYRTHIKNHMMVDESLITRPKIKVENNCFFCGMYFDNVTKFAKHLRDHNPQPYQCDVCSKSFKFKVHLIKHLQSHIKVTRSCICHHCGKMFKNPYIAQKHIKSHLMSDLVKCEVCGKKMKKGSVKVYIILFTMVFLMMSVGCFELLSMTYKLLYKRSFYICFL